MKHIFQYSTLSLHSDSLLLVILAHVAVDCIFSNIVTVKASRNCLTDRLKQSTNHSCI